MLFLSIIVRPVVGENLIYCPPGEEVCFNHELGLFVSDLMPGMPLVWEQLQSIPGKNDNTIRILMGISSPRITFHRVYVLEYLRNNLLVNKLVCNYRITEGSFEGFIELTPRQLFLERSEQLSFPVYLQGKKSNQCNKAREQCGFMIPEAAYRHRLKAHRTSPKSSIGRLIFSFLWVRQNSLEYENYPVNLSTITHPNQAAHGYRHISHQQGITAFGIISSGNVKTEKRSEILFEGKGGTVAAADYLSSEKNRLEGSEFYCSKVNFERSLARKAVAVMDVNVQLVAETVLFFNCSIHVSDTVASFQHDEL